MKYKNLKSDIVFVIFILIVSIIFLTDCSNKSPQSPSNNTTPPDTVVVTDSTVILVDCSPEIEAVLYATNGDHLVSAVNDTANNLYINIITQSDVFRNYTDKTLLLGVQRVFFLYEASSKNDPNQIEVAMSTGKVYKIDAYEEITEIGPGEYYYYEVRLDVFEYKEDKYYYYDNGWNLSDRFDRRVPITSSKNVLSHKPLITTSYK